MKIRDCAAIATGTLTFIAAVAAQWIWTKRPIEDVLFLAGLAAFLGVAVFAFITDSRQEKRRKHRARPIQHYEDWRPVFITLDKEGWGK